MDCFGDGYGCVPPFPTQFDAIGCQFSSLSLDDELLEPRYALPENLYRILRPDENPEGIIAKDSGAQNSVRSHVNCGSRRGYSSQFISTSASLDKAKDYKEKGEKQGFIGLRIGKIERDKLPSTCLIVDLTTEENRYNYLGKAVCKNYAKASAEVLLQCPVPIPCTVIDPPPQRDSRLWIQHNSNTNSPGNQSPSNYGYPFPDDSQLRRPLFDNPNGQFIPPPGFRAPSPLLMDSGGRNFQQGFSSPRSPWNIPSQWQQNGGQAYPTRNSPQYGQQFHQLQFKVYMTGKPGEQSSNTNSPGNQSPSNYGYPFPDNSQLRRPLFDNPNGQFIPPPGFRAPSPLLMDSGGRNFQQGFSSPRSPWNIPSQWQQNGGQAYPTRNSPQYGQQFRQLQVPSTQSRSYYSS